MKEKYQMKKTLSKIEKWNVGTHIIGVIFGLIILGIFIINKPIVKMNNYSYIIYAITFILLFLNSVVYHTVIKDELKKILRILDHCSIFIFIAGSYTPILINLSNDSRKNIFLILIWIIACIGLIYNLYIRKHYDKFKFISVTLYLIMGWISLFFMRNLFEYSKLLFLWILIGGLLYSIGVYFYKTKRIVYGHVIWHIFVLLASISQFIGIYFYL